MKLLDAIIHYKAEYFKAFGVDPKIIPLPRNFLSGRTVKEVSEYKEALLYYPPIENKYGQILGMEIILK